MSAEETGQPKTLPSYYRHIAIQAIDDAEGLRREIVTLRAQIAERDERDAAQIADLKRAREHAEQQIIALRAELDGRRTRQDDQV